MSDSDYIKASERERMQDAVDAVPRVTPGMFDDVCSSHAVADAVMRDLAEALREWVPCDCAWCSNPEYRWSCAQSAAANAALARYDCMTGGDDES